MTRGDYLPKYGLSTEQVRIMKDKFYKVKNNGGTDWENLDHFCQWAVEAGYKTGMRLRKFNNELPHSITNSFFAYPGADAAEKKTAAVKKPEKTERHGSYINSESPICSSCSEKDCPTKAFGCFKWREYFVNNWNKNICRKGRPDVKAKGNIFCYEHPDLVREGIVWQ